MYIGIDPGYAKETAIAWTENKKKIKHSLISVDKSLTSKDTRDLKKHAKAVYDFITKEITISNDKDTIIGIEGQFFGRNVGMVLELVEFRSLIVGMLYIKYPKARVYTILPNSWQSFVLHPPRGTKSLEMKELSKIAAKNLTGEVCKEDESDAINILKYIIEKF